LNNQNQSAYLDDEKIISVFKDYLAADKTHNHAILLDGAWGSGKTHFIKKTLIPAIEPDETIQRSAIYVSLYGIKTTEELQNALYMAIVTDHMKNAKIPLGTPLVSKLPFDKLFDTVGKLAKMKMKASGVEADVAGLVSPWLDFNEYYFIFDDLERCPMSINEIFGFINNFVEQNDAKVLIVANEAEICTAQNIDRDLFKMYIAAQGGIEWPKKNERNMGGRTIKRPYPDVNDIKDRAGLLVDEEDEYKRIKEKLIGRTIIYRPTFGAAIPKVFMEYLGDKIDECLRNSLIENICHVMDDEEHRNLRTLQFALSFYAKIYNKLPHDDTSAMVVILEAILRVSIGYKDTDYIYTMAESNDFESTASREGTYPRRHFVVFRFVLDYVYSGWYDFDEISSSIKRYCEAVQAKTTLDNLRYNQYEMEDCEIENNLQNLKCELEKGSYTSEYRNVLIALFYLKRVGFEICIDEYVGIMKSKIETGSVHVFDALGSGEQLHGDKEFFEDYKRLVNELKELTIQVQYSQNVQTLCEILDGKCGWSKQFEDYVEQHYVIPGRFEEFRHELFFEGVPEKYKSAIERGTTKECYAPILLLQNLFESDRRLPSDNRRYFAEYVEKIKKMYALLDFQSNSKMKQELIRYLRENLAQVIVHIESEEENDVQ